MNLIKRIYELKSNKVEKSIKLFGITDMHFTKHTRNNKLNSLLELIKTSKCDYIVFCGDLIDHTKRINDVSLKRLYDFFINVCRQNKVIFIKGNHDTKDSENEYYDLNPFFNKLSRLDNFYYLDGAKNKKIKFDNVTFYGFEFDNEFYYDYMEENEELIIERANKILKSIDVNEFNILLFHSPILLLQENVRKEIENINKIDLILCGHMHNGLVPDYFDKGSSHKGILSPRRKLFPSFARNMLSFNGTHAIFMYPLSYLYKVEKYGLEFIFRPGYQIITISK